MNIEVAKLGVWGGEEGSKRGLLVVSKGES